ncbi:MAG: TonB family protein [Deferribacteres bacterium]|nr:TonB family protein [candidate division KSB1 bacterium]MCB9510649.1 TonB family protein [Deferribacteres bacterium]
MFTNNPLRNNYPKYRDIATIITLILAIIAIRLAAEIDAIAPFKASVEIPMVAVEDIPITQQGKKKPPPPKPAVPIPSDSETIPEEETIEPIEFDFFAQNGDDGGGGLGNEGVGAVVRVPPRPISWVIPELPQKEKKKGIKGEVKVSIQIDASGNVIDAVVVENTTGSELCAQSAIKAALASRFIPAKVNGKAQKDWLVMPYRFNLAN